MPGSVDEASVFRDRGPLGRRRAIFTKPFRTAVLYLQRTREYCSAYLTGLASNERLMRIPFPTRLPLSYSCGFAVLLCIAQILEGTAPAFTLLSFAFILIATIAFNTAGGFAYPSGSYIFFYAVLAVIVGLTYKAYLGEPADTNLSTPITTMLVYVAGISGMLASAYFKRLVLPVRSLLGENANRIDLDAASIGCMIVGATIFFAGVFTVRAGGSAEDTYANNSGTLLSALNQVNQFLPLGIILGVTYQIKRSGGRRFLGVAVVVATAFSCLVFGIVGTSKQGLFQPIACVIIAAAAMRYRFSKRQVITFLLLVIFAFYYLVPYIQVGKPIVQGSTFLESIENSYDLITNLSTVRERMAVQTQGAIEADDYSIHYFNRAQGIFDRLQMISIDDALIDITQQGHVFGLSPLLYDMYNLVPHFIWPDKPLIALGNIYSHEIGIAHYADQNEDDTTTGISFSPSADAFHMAEWTGVLLVAPGLWFMCFFAMDYVSGDMRKSPWGLLMVAMCSHMAPEGMMSGPFYLTTIGPLTVIFSSILATHVLPLIGRVLIARRGAGAGTTQRSHAATRVSDLHLERRP